MKKLLHIVCFAVAAFISQQAFAGFGSAMLTIRTEKQDWLNVTFDGAQYNTQTNVFKLKNLAAGEHYLEVVRKDFEPNYHGPATYTVYSGWVTLTNGVETRGTVTQNNTLRLEQVTAYSPGNSYGYGNCGTNNYPNNYNNGYYNGYSYGYNNGYNCETYNNPWNQTYYCNYAMNQNDFAALKQTIAAQWFESTKLSTAKMGVNANYFTADQIRDLLMLFSFESSKVELAKYAYDRCIDKQNYFKVYDAFTFSSSVDELSSFVMNH